MKTNKATANYYTCCNNTANNTTYSVQEVQSSVEIASKVSL